MSSLMPRLKNHQFNLEDKIQILIDFFIIIIGKSYLVRLILSNKTLTIYMSRHVHALLEIVFWSLTARGHLQVVSRSRSCFHERELTNEIFVVKHREWYLIMLLLTNFYLRARTSKKIYLVSNLEITNIPSLGNQRNKIVACFMLVYSFDCDWVSSKIS